VRLLVAALVAQLVLGGAVIYGAVRGFPFLDGGGRGGPPAGPPGTAGPRVNRFLAGRAFAELRYQVSIGPRPAGSAVSRRLADHLRRLLPNGRFEPVPGGLRNVVGHLPGRRPAVVIGAHFDTKDIPGFVGANDSASGTASVIELARQLPKFRRPGGPELRFVLFDGEESPRGTADTAAAFLRAGLRGSKAYVRAHRGEVGWMILLDFVGERGLSLPREADSDAALWARLRAAAARVGVLHAFPARTRPQIYDDHTPFVRAGIPAIDLIDFDYPYFHTTGDTLDKVSAASLDIAGEAVLELVRGL
jgi:glutaminyl-peptide cyclotransferase